jgi:MOSC domain-containing protein YiiM
VTTWRGEVVAIHIAEKEGGEIRRVDEARAEEGRGLEGDRYWARAAQGGIEPKRHVTFIESEALEALARDYGIELSGADSRRNVLTRNVPLNHLVGRTFRVGSCVFRGHELSEPCGFLEKMTRKGVVRGMIHRAGLRAEIVTGGVLRPGDPIEEA